MAFRDGEDGYRLLCFQYGFIGKTEAHPLRRVQALIRRRGEEAEAIERFWIMTDIRAELEPRTLGED